MNDATVEEQKSFYSTYMKYYVVAFVALLSLALWIVFAIHHELQNPTYQLRGESLLIQYGLVDNSGKERLLNKAIDGRFQIGPKEGIVLEDEPQTFYQQFEEYLYKSYAEEWELDSPKEKERLHQFAQKIWAGMQTMVGEGRSLVHDARPLSAWKERLEDTDFLHRHVDVELFQTKGEDKEVFYSVLHLEDGRYIVHFATASLGVADTDYMYLLFIPGAIFSFAFATLFVRLLITYRKKRQQLQKAYEDLLQEAQAYERFVPQDMLQYLDRSSIQDICIGDHVTVDMAILYSDIRAFMKLKKEMTTEQNFKFVASYFNKMHPVVKKNEGFVDQWVGDSFRAFFPQGALGAIMTGIEMFTEIRDYNEGRKRAGYTPIHIGLALHQGEVMIGTVGDEEQITSTIVGKVLGVVGRLERLGKRCGAPFLISDQAYQALPNPEQFHIRPVGLWHDPIFNDPFEVYEVFDPDSEELRKRKKESMPYFATALEAYANQQYPLALTLFERLLRDFPEDAVVAYYVELGKRKVQVQEENSIIREDQARS